MRKERQAESFTILPVSYFKAKQWDITRYKDEDYITREISNGYFCSQSAGIPRPNSGIHASRTRSLPSLHVRDGVAAGTSLILCLRDHKRRARRRIEQNGFELQIHRMRQSRTRMYVETRWGRLHIAMKSGSKQAHRVECCSSGVLVETN